MQLSLSFIYQITHKNFWESFKNEATRSTNRKI